MEALLSTQSGHISQTYPCLAEWRNEIPRDLTIINEIERSSAITRPHQTSPPVSVRSLGYHDFHEVRAHNCQQPRSSPTIVDVYLDSPKRQKTSDSVSNTRSFPLPYKAPSASHLTSIEIPRTTTSLTSQDTHYYQSSSLSNHSERTIYSQQFDRPTDSTNFHDARHSTLAPSPGHCPSPGQPGWNPSSSQTWMSERIYCSSPEGDHRAPLKRRHKSRPNLSRHSRDSSFSPGTLSKRSFDTYISRTQELSHAGAEEQSASQAGDIAHPGATYFNDFSKGVAKCITKDFSSSGVIDSIRPIRETPYWHEMKDDPIFRDLAEVGPIVPLEELIARRNLILKSHVLSRPSMNERGTQTDLEYFSPITPRPSSGQTVKTSMDHSMDFECTKQTTQVTEPTSTNNNNRDSRAGESFPKKKSYGARKYRRSGKPHYTGTLPSLPWRQMRNRKGLRSATVDNEDGSGRNEATLTTNPRRQDTLIYSRRW